MQFSPQEKPTGRLMIHLLPSLSDEQTENSEETPGSYNNMEEKIVSERDGGT